MTIWKIWAIVGKMFYCFEELKMQNGRKLLDVVRDKIRVKHYSIKTEKSYVEWIKQFIFFS